MKKRDPFKPYETIRYLEKFPITDINYDLLRVLDDIRQKEWDKEDR